MVPFRGETGDAERALANLRRIELRQGDELRIADNSERAVLAESVAGATVLRAERERSSYHARNAAARDAAGEWLLFCDADCIPAPGLLDAYFAAPVAARVGAIAGAVAGDPAQDRLPARYARSRRLLSETAEGPGEANGSAVAGGNLLVRRAAFEAIGGFAEGVRSGGDVDLCLRLRRAGWELERRPAARVVHPHRETLRGLLGQIARYGAGARWLDARHPGAAPRWPLLRGLAGSARDVAANAASGRIEEASFRVLDAVGLVAHNVGYLSSNRTRRGLAAAPLRNGGEAAAARSRRRSAGS